MRNFFILWRKELTGLFLSPVAYVTMVVFIAAAMGTFIGAVMRNIGNTERLSILLFSSIFFWMPVLVTVVSMRLFAEEKRQGTLETLMTAPVTELEVVLGKYAGALSFILLAQAPVVGTVFLLMKICPAVTLAMVDPGAVAGGVLITVLLSVFLLSIGLLVSLLTSNQIISAICCFSANWLVLFFGWFWSMVPGVSRRVVEGVSATVHIEDFARGVIDLAPGVLYVSGAVFMLFTAVRVLESRRWL